jgi:hypothetical protein
VNDLQNSAGVALTLKLYCAASGSLKETRVNLPIASGRNIPSAPSAFSGSISISV